MLAMKEMTVLFAEDDPAFREPMKETLEMFCKEVLPAKDGREALELYELRHPNLILTDIKMPGRNGLSLIREIRENDYRTPIVLLSSYGTQEILIETLNLSVDGFLTKPVHLDSLIGALVRSLRRNEEGVATVHLGENTRYNRKSGELSVNDKPVVLGKKERKMLDLLIEKHSGVLSKEEISRRLWPLDDVADSTAKMLVMRLRKKIGLGRIVSVKGLGFRLKP